MDPWCYEGKCYSGQFYDQCKRKGLESTAESLGDGTWCFNDERRDTECLAVPGNIDRFNFFVLLQF